MTLISYRLETQLLWLDKGILALLLSLGVVVIIVFLARLAVLSRSVGDIDKRKKSMLREMSSDAENQLSPAPNDDRTIAGRIMSMGIKHERLEPEAIEKLFEIQASEEKRRLEQWVSFLGTVGATAPFLGLTGTVVGILIAFGKLAEVNGQGNSAVLSSISSALIATLVGLVVAIPSVVFHNVLRIRIKEILEKSQELRNLFLVRSLNSTLSKFKP